jgi:hypothetical protein
LPRSWTSQRLEQEPAQLPDDPAPEGEHADHEDKVPLGEALAKALVWSFMSQ